MFRHEHVHRTHRENLALAGFLSTMAGFVNAAGFVVVGVFTSHVTGNVGRIADDVSSGRHAAGVSAWLLVVAFCGGAFVASMAIESNLARRLPYTYAAVLVAEAFLLMMFAFGAQSNSGYLWRDISAGALCFGMGMQNSLVTRVSGAVVRTTHLTGIATDIGIEAARWFRHYRQGLARRHGVRLVLGPSDAAPPKRDKMELLALVGAAFTGGGVAGAFSARELGRGSLAIPSVCLLIGAGYAVRNGRVGGEDRH